MPEAAFLEVFLFVTWSWKMQKRKQHIHFMIFLLWRCPWMNMQLKPLEETETCLATLALHYVWKVWDNKPRIPRDRHATRSTDAFVERQTRCPVWRTVCFKSEASNNFEHQNQLQLICETDFSCRLYSPLTSPIFCWPVTREAQWVWGNGPTGKVVW